MIITDKRPKSFVLYADFEGALLRLSMRERGILFTMIYSYVNRGYVDEFEKRTPLVDMAFAIIRAQIDRDRKKYEEICLQNAENGKLGGRPRKENKTQRFSGKPKKAYNDNNNDNENNTDTDNKLKIGCTFDCDDFFAAALARSYGEQKKEEKEKKEEKQEK